MRVIYNFPVLQKIETLIFNGRIQKRTDGGEGGEPCAAEPEFMERLRGHIFRFFLLAGKSAGKEAQRPEQVVEHLPESDFISA